MVTDSVVTKHGGPLVSVTAEESCRVTPHPSGAFCLSPKRRQVEFTSKKNKALKERVKELKQVADDVAALSVDQVRDGDQHHLAETIRAIMLDVLVEL